MDPLSITASILTLLGAGSTVHGGFKRVLALKKAPDALIALNNEINDLHRIVTTIDDLLRRDPGKRNGADCSSFHGKLETTRVIAQDAEKLISYELTVVVANGQDIRIDRSKWLRSGSKLEQLKARIQSNKADLLLELGIFNSSLGIDTNLISRAIMRQIDEFKNSFQGLTEDEEIADAFSTRSSIRHHGRLSPASAIAHDSRIIELDGDNEPTSDVESDDDRISHEELQCVPSNTIYSTPGIPAANDHFQISTTAIASCDLACACACHKSKRLRSPRFLDRVMGSLMIGYRMSPVYTSPCNNLNCQRNTTRMTYTYAFPQWFLNRVLHTSITIDCSRGPELNLRVMRVRPVWALPFQSIMIDNDEMALVRTKQLLVTGEASVLDVDPEGDTLLWYALEYRRVDVIRLLIQSGADVSYQNDFGRSAYFQAWEKTLVLSHPVIGSILYLFPEADYTLFGFSALHRAVLQLPGPSFGNALKMIERSEFDDGDVQGMTALLWAARRGDPGIVSRLLECGADPDKQCEDHKTALHFAANNGHVECVEKLILAKANLEARDIYDHTPLHLASAEEDNASTVRLLIKHGADVNATDDNKNTALCYAISHNRHGPLRALLECKNLRLSLGHTPSLLEDIALWSDIKTLRILVRAIYCLKIDFDARHDIVDNAREFALERLEANETMRLLEKPYERLGGDPASWYKLFQKLCFKILHPPEDRIDVLPAESLRAENDGTFGDSWESSGDEEEESSSEEGEFSSGEGALSNEEEKSSNEEEESSDEGDEWQDAPESN